MIGGAGVVGILIAFLVFPSPDTGGDVPDRVIAAQTEAPSTPGMELPTEVEEGNGMATRPMLTPTTGSRTLNPSEFPRGTVENGVNPLAAGLIEHKNTPDAIFAGRFSGPWTLLRRDLLRQEGAEEVAGRVNELVGDLREARRDPEKADFTTLDQRQRQLLAELRGSMWVNDDVSRNLDRIDQLLAEWDESRQNPQ